MVSILILNYNGFRFLKNCLDSVLSQSYKNFEVIFFDNASTDNSINYVKGNYNFEQIKIISSKVNLGFTGGNNKGLKHCSGELIVLLNNDTIVEKSWLKNLIEDYDSCENPGIIQSLVITEGIKPEYYEMNGTINLLGHNIMKQFEIAEIGIGKILLATGACMMFRKSLVKELDGLFPEEYFFYAEDTFFSLRSIFAGYNNYHTSNSAVRHIGSGSIGKKKNSFVTFCQERNRLLNFLVLFSPKFFIKYIPFLIFNFFVKIIRGLVSSQYSLTGLFRAYYWLLANTDWINNKRDELSKYKKISEEEVLKLISGKIFNGENILEKIINFFSVSYCRIASINILELQKKT